ncbi:hypothetical protein GUJ93_ZPchr0013g35306 [Zizania palustris]|uniref:Uncharacterized protein n=1 Tax=Zizania palustris TaxID=103762 RepID=A0A8J5WYS0_ZIZPA|nr:hypothetical protein GUJ93_ZPchr0013g35306 [Zizania palustris]
MASLECERSSPLVSSLPILEPTAPGPLSSAADKGRAIVLLDPASSANGLLRDGGLAAAETSRYEGFGPDVNLLTHSWSSGGTRWLWVPRGVPFSEDLGFPSTPTEVRQFGGLARRIHKVAPRYVDSRSFAHVVLGESMANPWRNESAGFKKRADRDENWTGGDGRPVRQRDWKSFPQDAVGKGENLQTLDLISPLHHIIPEKS